jgi:hypothetical protein
MKALEVAEALDNETMDRIESILENKPDPMPNHRE